MNSGHIKFSIVIPCYNEAENLPALLQGYDDAMARDDVEILISNDGSADGTEDVLNGMIPSYPFVRAIHSRKNEGYGAAIRLGLSEAGGEFVGWTHGDLQTPPKDVFRAIELIEGAPDPEKTYVKGMRRGRPAFDAFFSNGMSLFETLLFRAALYEINAQPNIFHRSFFQSWGNPPSDFSLDLYSLYHAKRQGLSVRRFPVRFDARLHGKSSWNTGLKSRWKFIKRTLRYSFALRKAI